MSVTPIKPTTPPSRKARGNSASIYFHQQVLVTAPLTSDDMQFVIMTKHLSDTFAREKGPTNAE